MAKAKGGTTRAATQVKAAAIAPAPREGKAAFDFFLARATALRAPDVPVSRGEAAIVKANVDRAAKVLAPHLGDLARVAPAITAATITDLPALARAFDYAEKRVPKMTSDRSIDAALADVSPVRTAALAYLDAAAFAGLVDAGRVRAIRAGHGKLDVARDAVAIAGLFDELGRALDGKHPFTAEHLAILRDEGAWLVERLKPTGAVRDPKERAPEALVKDRFARLVELDYAVLGQAAVALLGVDGYRDQIPALYARAAAKGAKAPPAG